MSRADPVARTAVRSLRASKIREVANAAMGDASVLPFWFGEPDEVTPDFIRAAAIAALDAGDTFYTHNLGIAPLREARLGLAPGAAFGPEGEGFVRGCFASSEARLAEGVERLARALEGVRA